MLDFSYYGDKFYIGDIPLDCDKVLLYFDKDDNLPVICSYFTSNNNDNEPITTYKILNGLNGNKLFYSSTETSIGSVRENNSTLYRLPCTKKFYDRNDYLSILCTFCCVSVITLWLVNLFTSIFKKGGLLSGLF